MRIVYCAASALLLIALSLAGSVTVADREGYPDATTTSNGASLRADIGGIAGAFIKPATAAPSLAEPPEEQRGHHKGAAALERRDSGPFSPYSLHHLQPPALSASVRRAHLNVYRL